MLQSNRTATEQDPSFWPLAAPLWNSVNISCIVDPHVICFWRYTLIQLGSSRIVEKSMGCGTYFCEVQNAIIALRTNGYGSRYQEPNLESACLDHGHVKRCYAYVRPMLGLCWLFDAMLWPYSSHVVFFLSLYIPDPKGTRHYWIMSGPCWAYMEPMLGLCWSMLGSWRLC